MTPEPLPQSAFKRSLALYRTLGPLVAAFLAPVFLRRLIKRGGYQKNFRQRFGHFEATERQRLMSQTWTWIRSISVGETLVALKLAKALKAEEPSIKISLSVTTSTGFALASQEASDWLFVFYNPIDSQAAVHKVMGLLRPRRLILVEGELWPNLLAACVENNVPVILANARLSPRSARRFARFRKWTAPFFETLDWVGIPDEEDRARWVSIGVPEERIHLTGSIKFDYSQPDSKRQKTFEHLLHKSGVRAGEPLIVAGSTHDGEETLLVQALKTWRTKHPTVRLLIAPRHVERIPEILRELNHMDVAIATRSSLPTAAPWDVLLLDTTGELRDWYPLSTVAFIGKSLTTTGGQNPVEPALCGKPVVFGPHMENFESIVNLLLTLDGALQACSSSHMEELIGHLLEDQVRRQQLGKNARSALAQHQGSSQRTARLIIQTAVAQED